MAPNPVLSCEDHDPLLPCSLLVWSVQNRKNKGNSSDSRISEVMELFAPKKEGMPVTRAREVTAEENATGISTAPQREYIRSGPAMAMISDISFLSHTRSVGAGGESSRDVAYRGGKAQLCQLGTSVSPRFLLQVHVAPSTEFCVLRLTKRRSHLTQVLRVCFSPSLTIYEAHKIPRNWQEFG